MYQVPLTPTVDVAGGLGLTFPLVHLIKQLELLLQAYCFEIVACNHFPEPHAEKVHTFAQDLVQCMALSLAEMIASLVQGALYDPSLGLVDGSNAPQPIYTELLNAGCRYRAIREKEARRPSSGLVKATCVPYEGRAEYLHKGKRKVDTSRINLLGDRCWASSLLVWFPAAWMPLVAEALRNKNREIHAHLDTAVPHARDGYLSSLSFKLKRLHVLPTIYKGMLADIYCQKLATAWEHAAPTRVQVSMLLVKGLLRTGFT